MFKSLVAAAQSRVSELQAAAQAKASELHSQAAKAFSKKPAMSDEDAVAIIASGNEENPPEADASLSLADKPNQPSKAESWMDVLRVRSWVLRTAVSR